MTNTQTTWESFKIDSAAIIDKIKGLIHEGNIRRVIIGHYGRTIAEFPLTAGVVGAVLAPVVAAIAAVVVLFKDCTIHVEREPDRAASDSTTESSEPAHPI